MLSFNLLTLFKQFPPFLWLLVFTFLLKLLQIGILFHHIWVFAQGIYDYVEQSNRSACIMGELLHEKYILRHNLGVESFLLVFFEVDLDGRLLVEEHYSENRVRQHGLGPLLNGE